MPRRLTSRQRLVVRLPHEVTGLQRLLLTACDATIRSLPEEDTVVPPDLLHAIAQRGGRVALVVGAGCSLEEPTGLKLSNSYSVEIHQQLLLDGILEPGDCPRPEDLSVLATTVSEKLGQQAPVVQRLPIADLRLARPNAGYLIAAALLREGAVTAVLTLNFDLAMSSALVDTSATDVAVVPGPEASERLAPQVVIYLHRNVDEPDPEQWILRAEALEDEWRDGWEEVVAQRVMSSPVVVFAGLGSRAEVLVECIKRIRNAVDVARHRAYVVDLAAETPFKDALDLPNDAHIQLGWCAFMEKLADRLVAELRAQLETSCNELCDGHGWDAEVGFIADLATRLHGLGLVAAGRLRAAWLLARESYVPDDPRRGLIADLLLAVGLIERRVEGTAVFREDGVVEIHRGAAVIGSFLPASGCGTLRWSAMEASVLQAIQAKSGPRRPQHALLGGMQGERPHEIAPPEDVARGDQGWDISLGQPRPEFVTIDEIRADVAAVHRIVA